MGDMIHADTRHELTDSSDPAAAFAALTREVALLRRATEGLSAEKARLEMPDYTPTLGAMEAGLTTIGQAMEAIAEAPALQLTPNELAERISAVAERSRRTDKATIEEARAGHYEATAVIRNLVGVLRTKREQQHHLLKAVAGGVAAGCLLWSILPGVILRSLPASWHMPESMAAHILGEPNLWDAGSRMMSAGDPGSWRSTVRAAEMWRDNRYKIAACEMAAAKARDAVRCVIRIRPRNVQ